MVKRLARLLETLNRRSARDFLDSESFAPHLRYGEETITERFLLDLARFQRGWPKNRMRVVSIMHAKKGKIATAEETSGADWEWYFGTPSASQWFGVRVQAKKANPYGGPWGYWNIAKDPPAISKKTGLPNTDPPQIEKLIDQARKYQCWAVYALYDTQFDKSQKRLATCHNCPRLQNPYAAMTYADARAMRTLRKRKTLGRDNVRRISAPMPCIVDCLQVKRTPRTLATHVQAAAQQLAYSTMVDGSVASPGDVPAMTSALPERIQEVLRRADESGGRSLFRVEGTLVREQDLAELPIDLDSADDEASEGPEHEDPYDNLAGVVVIEDDGDPE